MENRGAHVLRFGDAFWYVSAFNPPRVLLLKLADSDACTLYALVVESQILSHL